MFTPHPYCTSLAAGGAPLLAPAHTNLQLCRHIAHTNLLVNREPATTPAPRPAPRSAPRPRPPRRARGVPAICVGRRWMDALVGRASASRRCYVVTSIEHRVSCTLLSRASRPEQGGLDAMMCMICVCVPRRACAMTVWWD